MSMLAMHELRYALMRLTRSVLCLVAFALAVVAMVPTVLLGIATGFATVGFLFKILFGADCFSPAPLWVWFTPVYFLIGVATMATCMGCWLSIGSPYRYKTIPPGIPSMACPKCGLETPIFGRCVECKEPLPKQAHSMVGMAINWLVTIVNILIDVMSLLVGQI